MDSKIINFQFLLLLLQKEINYNKLITIVETNSLDYDYLYKFSIKHGILPLVYTNLKKLPNIPSNRLDKFKTTYMSIAKKNMLMSSELIKILQILKADNINVIPFKGPVLAKLAYEDITLRQFGDLDIFVSKSDFDRISSLLLEKDYDPYYPIEQYKTAKKTLFELNNDVPFFHKEKKISIEIHWYFFRKLYISTSLLNPWENQQIVQINNYNINTLSHSTHLLYHSLHGSKHIWEKFVWIVDIDRFIRNIEDIDWHDILDIATQMGVKKMFLLGPALAKYYLDTPLPSYILDEISKAKLDNIIQYIDKEFKSEKQTPEDSLSKLYKVILLKDNLFYKTMTLFEFIFKPGMNERRMIILSDNLFGLYWLIRPLGMIYRFVIYKIFKSYNHNN